MECYKKLLNIKKNNKITHKQYHNNTNNTLQKIYITGKSITVYKI